LFTHFKQAYDSVNIIYLYEILNEFGIQKKAVNLIKITLQDSNGLAKLEEQLTDASDIERSFRQGDALSTVLFNMVLESQSQWLRGLRRGSADAHLLGLRI
jgi:hypothetical protein